MYRTPLFTYSQIPKTCHRSATISGRRSDGGGQGTTETICELHAIAEWVPRVRWVVQKWAFVTSLQYDTFDVTARMMATFIIIRQWRQTTQLKIEWTEDTQTQLYGCAKTTWLKSLQTAAKIKKSPRHVLSITTRCASAQKLSQYNKTPISIIVCTKIYRLGFESIDIQSA